MTSIQDEIFEEFINELGQSQDFPSEVLLELRNLLSASQKAKAEKVVAALSMDVKETLP